MSSLPSPQGEPRGAEPDISPGFQQDDDLVRFLDVLGRHRLAVFVIPAIAAVLVLALTLLRGREYASEAAFVPQQTQRMASPFSGLAAQFGIEMPTDRLDQSPAFYADLLESREILGGVVETEFAAVLHGGSAPRTLIELYGIDEADADARRFEAIRELRDNVRPSTTPQTGVVEFSVRAETPPLARAVAEEILRQVNGFNLRRRQSVAEAERTFVEERLAAANDELAAAENRLQRFDERNLRIDNSPELRLERDRLQRQVAMRQEVVTMLTQAYEQARIDEVRNTPAVTIIETPSLPVRPEPRGAAQSALLAFVVFGFLGTVYAFGRELVYRLRTRRT